MPNKQVDVEVAFHVFFPCGAPRIVFFFCLFRVNEFNTKEFKTQVEKAKTCRELIEVLKVSVSLVDVTVLGGKGGGGGLISILFGGGVQPEP